MESSPSPQKSRSQSHYNLPSSSSQQLKTMAISKTTDSPTSPRTKSQQQEQLHVRDTSSTPNNTVPSASANDFGSSSKKRPLPKESTFKDNNSNTTSGIQSKVIVTTPPQSTTATTATAHRILSKPTFDISQITHEAKDYMFKLRLDSKGNIAALCYLPTRYPTLVEFYHTEVPLAYRHMGIGDLLVKRAFEWVEQSNLLVIPSCSFVLRYLKTHYPDMNSGQWNLTVDNEVDALDKLAHRI